MADSRPNNVDGRDVDDPDGIEILDAPAPQASSSSRYRSPIWEHFKKADNLKIAICNHCKAQVCKSLS